MGLFNHFPYTNFHEMNLDWILSRFRSFVDTINNFSDKFEGGSKGQILRKKTDLDLDFEWASVSAITGSLPTGGVAGQILQKISNSEFDAAWVEKYDYFVTPEMFGAVGDGVTDDTTALKNMLLSGIRNIEFAPNKTYKLTETLDITNIIINGNGSTILHVTADEFTFNNQHKQVYRIFDNVKIINVNFEGTYTDEAERWPLVGEYDVAQAGLAIKGSNVVINGCNFKYFLANTIEVYEENISNINIENCKITDVGNAIQMETPADKTGAAYSVVVKNCYIKASASTCGIGNYLIEGCTFVHLPLSTYPNFQLSINDANVADGACGTVISSKFISDNQTAVANVVVYGFNDAPTATHNHKGFGTFIGCTFEGYQYAGIRIAGDVNFDSCIFRQSVTSWKGSATKYNTPCITITNCIWLGNNRRSDGIEYLVFSADDVLGMHLTMIGCHTDNTNSNLRLITISEAVGDQCIVVMLNNISGPNNLSKLKTRLLYIGNRNFNDEENLVYDIDALIKYRWITDVIYPYAINTSYLSDNEFLEKSYGVYYFDDNKLRFIGKGENITLATE